MPNSFNFVASVAMAVDDLMVRRGVTALSAFPHSPLPPPPSLMAAWRSLLLRIGDRGPDKCLDCGSSDDPKEYIDICAGVLLREIEYSKGEILEFLLQCTEQLPHKIPLYGVLVGSINLENEDFAKELVDITLSDLQAALNSRNVNSIRILLRFLTGLMCWKVILPGSIIEVFETFVSSAATTIDDDSGNSSWQPCADFYAFCILSCLPWGAAELFEITV